MTPLRLKAWPFRGRIGIREHNPATGRTDVHIVDRWRYLGTAASEADLQYLLEERVEPAFDVDSYRLFSRYLSTPRRGIDIIDL